MGKSFCNESKTIDLLSLNMSNEKETIQVDRDTAGNVRLIIAQRNLGKKREDKQTIGQFVKELVDAFIEKQNKKK
jgi:hypothetical protein